MNWKTQFQVSDELSVNESDEANLIECKLRGFIHQLATSISIIGNVVLLTLR